MNAPTHNTPDDFTLQRDAWGQLTLSLADGRQLTGVEVARAFPISAPGEYVSICDAEGHEVLCIEDPSTLPPNGAGAHSTRSWPGASSCRSWCGSKQVLADTDPSQWRIVTDRGPTTFLMEDSDNDVRRLGPNRILLVDTHGIRYLIPDTRRLDGGSRRILDRYL